jgi:hypothetical protein
MRVIGTAEYDLRCDVYDVAASYCPTRSNIHSKLSSAIVLLMQTIIVS